MEHTLPDRPTDAKDVHKMVETRVWYMMPVTVGHDAVDLPLSLRCVLSFRTHVCGNLKTAFCKLMTFS